MSHEPIDMPQGTVDLLILKILALGPRHGWSIAERLHQLSSAALHIKQGSLYPALHRLERSGWLKAAWGTIRQQPPREILRVDAQRPRAARRRSGRLAEARGCHLADPRSRVGGRMFGDWLFRLRSILRSQAVDRELDEELRFHLDQQVAAYIRGGMDPTAARPPCTDRVRRPLANQGRKRARPTACSGSTTR